MRFSLILFGALLAGCVASDHNKGSLSRDQLILGLWILEDSHACYVQLVEYRSDKSKTVTIRYCSEEGDILEDWYESKWEISGNRIIETTYRATQSLIDELQLELPHVEDDLLEFVSADRLVITDERMTSVYVRPDRLLHN